ncbi:MAG: hypothetical protein ACI8U4_001870 [Natronomonas sp.]
MIGNHVPFVVDSTGFGVDRLTVFGERIGIR